MTFEDQNAVYPGDVFRVRCMKLKKTLAERLLAVTVLFPNCFFSRMFTSPGGILGRPNDVGPFKGR